MNGKCRAFAIRVDVTERTVEPDGQPIVPASVLLRTVRDDTRPNASVEPRRDLQAAGVRVVDPRHWRTVTAGDDITLPVANQ